MRSRGEERTLIPPDQSIALITGASSGIGEAIAKRLAQDGFFTLVHYNTNQKGAEATLQSIVKNGGCGKTLRFDVKDSKNVEHVLNGFFAETQNKIEVLVNNAGIHNDLLAGMMTDEAFDSVIKTNLYGPFYLMRWCVRKMIRQRSGCIVNISSISGQIGNPGQINYAASKAGLIAMTKSLSQEVGSRGIRVNAIAAGLVDTEMIKGIPFLDEIKKRIPLGRLARPEEIAGVASFLCSQDASYITGQTLAVNGGLLPL